jgi:hypothetical protein
LLRRRSLAASNVTVVKRGLADPSAFLNRIVNLQFQNRPVPNPARASRRAASPSYSLSPSLPLVDGVGGAAGLRDNCTNPHAGRGYTLLVILIVGFGPATYAVLHAVLGTGLAEAVRPMNIRSAIYENLA